MKEEDYRDFMDQFLERETLRDQLDRLQVSIDNPGFRQYVLSCGALCDRCKGMRPYMGMLDVFCSPSLCEYNFDVWLDEPSPLSDAEVLESVLPR